MRATRLLILFVVFSLLLTSAIAQEETETPEPEMTEAVAPEATDEPVETTPEPEMTAEATAEPTMGTIYTVRFGDTLFRIALRNGLTTADLAEANGITNPNLIFAGQQITIPSSDDATPTPKPATPEPGATIEYVVQPGDTLFRLAVTNSTTVSVLADLNELANPNLILIGQTLLIPAEA